jgi:predicted permease
MRLMLAPLVAVLMVAAWSAFSPAGLGTLGPVMIIAAGMPVAVNVYVLSVEYQRDSDLASQTIFLTTLLSALTLTGWLLFVS